MALSLDSPLASGFPRDVGALGEAMCNDRYLRYLNEWSATRGLDSPSVRHPTGLPPGLLTLHPSSGRFGSIHKASVLAHGHTRFQSANIPYSIPLLEYANDMTFFIQGSMVAAHNLSSMVDIFSDFSDLRLNRAKSTFLEFGLLAEKMKSWLRPNLGDAYWRPTDPVSWSVACQSLALAPGLTSGVREGRDALGRLAGIAPVTRGFFDSIEGDLGRYIHLLHVNHQDAGRRQETSREDYVELLLARFPARGVIGDSACRVVYRMLACVSRRARYTSRSAHQHEPSYQVGAPALANFVRLSICGAARRVRIFTRLGDLADPEAWQLRINVERAIEFPVGIEILPPSTRGRGDFRVLGRGLVES